MRKKKVRREGKYCKLAGCGSKERPETFCLTYKTSNFSLGFLVKITEAKKSNSLNNKFTALSDIQMQLYQFLNHNITYENYLGEGVNSAGRIQVFFKVKD